MAPLTMGTMQSSTKGWMTGVALTVGLALRCGTTWAADLPAFPGAEGYGAVSVGGRGGRILAVTNGMLATYPRSGNISIHHNLFAHQSERNPALAPYEREKPGDVRNNVIYDFHGGLNHAGHIPAAPVNVINNYFERGPSSEEVVPFVVVQEGQYYVAGNHFAGIGPIDGARAAASPLPDWLRILRRGTPLEQPAAVAPVTTDTAEVAYLKVLGRAGCLPRDRVSHRTVREIRDGAGRWGRHAPTKPDDDWFLQGLKREQPPKDTDGDGMPDAWEDAHGLNKQDSADHSSLRGSGYTAIEEYLNERAAQLIRENAEPE